MVTLEETTQPPPAYFGWRRPDGEIIQSMICESEADLHQTALLLPPEIRDAGQPVPVVQGPDRTWVHQEPDETQAKAESADSLVDDLAIELLTEDFADIMVPAVEGRKRAEAHKDARTDGFLGIRRRVIGVLALLRERGMLREGMGE